MVTGNKAEDIFRTRMEEMGREVIKSNKDTDMFKHIDFFVDGVSYDVKTEKRYSRESNDNDNTIWIEAINVRGNKGWLYGEADNIAFLIDDVFHIVNRSDLVSYIEKEITCEKIFPIKRYKKWYRRQNRKDKITYLYPRDIIKITKEKI